MDDEELCATPSGVLLADAGGVCFVVFVEDLKLVSEGGAVGRVEVEDAHNIHDEGRAAEKLVRAVVC